MKRSEVTADVLRALGYKAVVEYTGWTQHVRKECNARQSAELFELVAKTAREGGEVKIERNHVRGVVTVHVNRCARALVQHGFYCVLQREMTDAEIFEASIKTGLWVERGRKE